MRILGIDTSLRSTGFGVVESRGESVSAVDCGIIKNKSSLTHSQCLLRIAGGLEQLIYEYKPDEIAIESPFYHKSAKTAVILGMAKGAVLTACAKADLPIYEYAPKKAKKSVVGTGDASKQQVAVMMSSILNVDITFINDDATDALALAVCHLNARKTLGGKLLGKPI